MWDFEEREWEIEEVVEGYLWEVWDKDWWDKEIEWGEDVRVEG